MSTAKTLHDCFGGLALLLMAGCAAAPNSITAAPVAPGAYSGLDCDHLSIERAAVDTELSDLEKHQETARTWDGVGLILFGLPMSSMTGGNHENDIAKLKGQHNALVEQGASCGLHATR